MASRQRGIVQGQITSGTLFPNMFIAMSTRIEKLVRDNEENLLEIQEAMMLHIAEDVDFALDSARPPPRDEAKVQRLLEKVRELKTEAEEVGRVVAEEA